MRAVTICVLLYVWAAGVHPAAAQHGGLYSRDQGVWEVDGRARDLGARGEFGEAARRSSRARRSASDDDIAVLLRAHNAARAAATPTAANMKNMFWDDRLAFKAQSYSAKCRYRPNPDASVGGEGFDTAGENLYASPASADLAAVVASWQADGSRYDFASNTCQEGADCSSYTQLMWATSYKVGCGWTVCPSLDNFDGSDVFFLVCNYGPG
ncbi:GLIPR1-like protein 1 [Branchiostoma lanceolatum]|uniref:GLIPR1-like protein 1 n=1 Tax=Branchiostoma lanceolatum TaxID=7740 RepID=UPI003454CFEE